MGVYGLLDDGLTEDELSDFTAAVDELDSKTLRALALDLLGQWTEASEPDAGLIDRMDDAAVNDFVLFLAALNNDLSLSSVFGEPVEGDDSTMMMSGGWVELVSATVTPGLYSRSEGGSGKIGGTLFAPMMYEPQGWDRVEVSIDENPAGVAITGLASFVWIPPGDYSWAPLEVTPVEAQVGTFTGRATYQGQVKTDTFHVVDTTDVTPEWQRPDTGAWVTPDTFLVGEPGVPVFSTADNVRWKADFSHDIPAAAEPVFVSLEAIAWSDWLAREDEPPVEPWPEVTGNNCAGDPGSRQCFAYGAPDVGDWAVRAVVWYNGGPAGGGGGGGGEPARQLEPERVVMTEIESVNWVEAQGRTDAGDLTTPPSSHAGEAFFPGAEAPLSPANRAVRVDLQINPDMAGIPIQAKWFDVDDGFYETAPLDDDSANPNDVDQPDNRLEMAQFDGGGQQVQLVSDANGEASVVFLTSMQPGNNYRIASTLHQVNMNLLKPRTVIGAGLLWKDLDGDNLQDGAEPLLDDSDMYITAEAKLSPLLTIWRKLHVEVDSMGPPPPGTVFPDDMIAIDVDPGDVPEPDTTLLFGGGQPQVESPFWEAFVQPVADTGNNNGNAVFEYHLDDDELEDQGNAARGTIESINYWVGYIQAAYEGPASLDNDPNTEDGQDGINLDDPEPEYAFIFIEVLRDLTTDEFPAWDRTVVEQRTVVHEIGHQFELPHSHLGIMEESTDPTVRTSSFTEESLAVIRGTIKP